MSQAIYIIASAGRIKIGFSSNPWKRYRDLSTGCPTPMALVLTLYCKNAPQAEKVLHDRFKEQREHGEWFRASVGDVMMAIVDLGIEKTTWNPDSQKDSYQLYLTNFQGSQPMTELEWTESKRPATKEEGLAFLEEMRAMINKSPDSIGE